MKKVILYYPDLGEEAIQCLVDWIQEKIDDKSPTNNSPLRYVSKMEVDR